MTQRVLSPLAAFKVTNGRAAPMDAAWPSVRDAEHNDHGYDWLHFDVAEPTFESWARENLPEIASGALLQDETRPRCNRLEDGIILNLRGVNLNPDASPEDRPHR